MTCLHLPDEVSPPSKPFAIARRGNPVAPLVPAEPGGGYGIAEGTINYAAGDDLCSTGEKWDAED